MIKEKILKIGGEKKRQDKVWTNQRVFWGKMAVFFEIERGKTKSVKAGWSRRAHNRKREEGKTVRREGGIDR